MNGPLPRPLYKLPSSLGKVMLEYKAAYKFTGIRCNRLGLLQNYSDYRNVCVSNLHVRSCALRNCQRASISKTYDNAVDYDDSYLLERIY